jgi:hypothetical protein
MRGWMTLLAIVGGLLLVVLTRADRRRFLASAAVLSAMISAFSVGLLVMYLFSFGPYEGPRLASYGRYMGIVLLAVWASLLGWAAVGADYPGWRGAPSKLLAVLMAAGMAACASEMAPRLLEEGPERVEPIRRQVRLFTRQAIRGTPEDARIYILAFGSNGLAGYVARYELAPRVTNRGCFGLGSPRFEGDVWTCPTTVDQMRQLLRDYDFVLLGEVDERFWQEFGVLFTERAATRLFVVDKRNGIRLSPQPERALVERSAR